MSEFVVRLLLAVVAGTGQYRGLSAFSALDSRFPCAEYLALSALSDAPAMPVLYRKFGANFSCVERFKHRFRERPHLVQVHFSYEKPKPRILSRKRIEARTHSILVRLSKPNKNTTYALTAGLEDRLNEHQARRRISWIRNVWPHLVIRNPERGGSRAGADLIERHTRSGAGLGAVISNDGWKVRPERAAAYARRFSQAAVLYLWTPALQDCCGPVKDRRYRITDEDRATWKRFLRG